MATSEPNIPILPAPVVHSPPAGRSQRNGKMEKRWIWPFELEEQIGSGAMGLVYRARFVKNDRRVALKLLPAEVAANATLAARFQREMEILNKLPVPRLLVVVKKSGASVPDPINSRPEWHPPYRRDCGAHCFRALAKDGAQRVFGEHVFYVGQHQLLMLLFVIDAQDNSGREPLEEILIFQDAFHQRIYSMSVF